VFFLNSKISSGRQKQLILFQKQAGVKFKDMHLLDCAFKHSSSVKKHYESNERLEFLGDSVLGLVVADMIYRDFSKYNEGELARIKSASVSEDSLASVAASLHIADYLVLGKGEEMSGGKEKKAILADAVEAVIGALYLDSGYKVARNFVLRIMNKQIGLVAEHKCYEDYKSLLQEIAQRRFKSLPKYTLDKTEGPDHDLRFWVSLKVASYTFGPCVGKTKKDAEQEAASLACQKLKC